MKKQQTKPAPRNSAPGNPVEKPPLPRRQPYRYSAQKPINRNSKWQYLVIIVSLILMTLSALPNLYPKQAMLLLSQKSANSALIDATQLHQDLSQQGFQPESIDANAGTSRIVLQAADQIPAAQQYLSATMGDQYSVEVVNESATPRWLEELGGQPIKLGLDLSGGVLFVLQVDGEKAFAERMLHVKQATQSLLRNAKLHGVMVSLSPAQKVIIESSQPASLARVFADVQQQFPGLEKQQKDDRQFTLFYSDIEQTKFHQEIMQQTLTTMRGRIEELGITEAVVQRQGADRIRIELPGANNPEEAKPIIGATATLDFYQLQSVGGKIFTTELGEKVSVDPIAIFSGKHIKHAQAGRDEMGMPLVNLTLDSVGGDKMLKFSARNIGQPMVTVFSEYYQNQAGKTEKSSKVINVATIQQQLGTRFSITHLSSVQEAQELALLLRAGSLTAPVTIVTQRTITATLGESNIQQGMAALILGMGFTLLFMALWYRRLGLIANVALVFNLVCLIGLLSLLPGAVLTLPGIAGLVLTVGMAVDTNVLIFERIKEEQKRGRSFALAVEHGYKNAFATILDANVTTLITAALLYSIGYGPVKGFAVTLGLGILTSLFSGVFVSRALTNIVYARNFISAKRAGATS